MGHERFHGRLSIPAIGGGGHVYSLRFRCLAPHNCKEAGCPKYLGVSGVPTRLFNIRALHEATAAICITEGELDAVILTQCGYPAVGACGSESWKRHHPRMFADFPTVYVLGDGDKAGREYAKTIHSTLSSAVIVDLPEGADVTDLYVAGGLKAIREMFP